MTATTIDMKCGHSVMHLPSPLGPLLAAADEQGVTFLEFAELAGVDGALRRLIGDSDAALETSDDNRHLARLSDELAEYFDGRRDTFTVPVVPRGTDFELKVWEYLRSIPFGQTRSYGQQARAVGSPGAARAVGRANGRNNIAIVIPCHRVIGADGSLTGFGGGLDRKRWLLEHESRASRLL